MSRNDVPTLSLADVDLFNPDTFANGVPHDALKLLRREAPVYHHPEPGAAGFWALTKYDDVVTASMDPVLFSSARGLTLIADPPAAALGIMQNLMLNMDPPRHTKYRRLVSKGFTPKIVREMEPHIRRITTEIIDRVSDRSECDFVTDIAAELPLQVILEMMGVPLEDRKMVFDWSNTMIGGDDSEYSPGHEDGKRASMEIYAYANRLALERRRHPGADIVSVLMEAEVDGEKLSEPEFDAFFLLLSVAGNETTRNLIAGAMLALIEHPEQRARLLANPSLVPTGVEEMLRWTPPVICFRRTATRDTEMRGQAIREGDKVVMYYPSANRDEDYFPDGDVFDVGRSPNEHVTFGPGGTHFCLGANLARLEIRVIFEELFRRLPDIELAAPVQRLRSNWICGIKHMPVRYTPERA